MLRGAFITVEGIEGVGKSTCLAAVESCLHAAGRETRLSREPGGTALGEQLRDWILHGEHGTLSAHVEALLMLAARAQHIDEVIEPALTAGTWVVCDRFSDATMAYQGGGRGADKHALAQMIATVQGRTVPDLTLLLDAPVDVGFERISGRPHDHFEREDRAFFERVRSTYLDIAKQEPGRVKVVDAAADVAAVRRQIQVIVDAFVNEYSKSHA